MPRNLTVQLTVSDEIAQFLAEQLSRGRYSSEGDLFTEAVQAFRDDDELREQWLHEVAVPAYHKFCEDPSVAVSFDYAKAELAEDLQASLHSK